MGQGHSWRPNPPLTQMTLGQWVSQSRPAVTQPGIKPRSVVTPLALRCSALDRCATQETPLCIFNKPIYQASEITSPSCVKLRKAIHDLQQNTVCWYFCCIVSAISTYYWICAAKVIEQCLNGKMHLSPWMFLVCQTDKGREQCSSLNLHPEWPNVHIRNRNC